MEFVAEKHLLNYSGDIMVYERLKLVLELPDGKVRSFDIDMECYIEDLYNLLIRFAFKYNKYSVYYKDELIDSGNKLNAAEKLEELSHPKIRRF